MGQISDTLVKYNEHIQANKRKLVTVRSIDALGGEAKSSKG